MGLVFSKGELSVQSSCTLPLNACSTISCLEFIYLSIQNEVNLLFIWNSFILLEQLLLSNILLVYIISSCITNYCIASHTSHMHSFQTYSYDCFQ